MKTRVSFLDGQRGLAILMVLAFHAYSRWTDLVPYGARFRGPFAAGFLGVELFFMISGFVILMTLEKSSGIRDFIVRRWLRLFPAMLVCTALVYFTSSLFSERPLGQPTAWSVLPGLLFIEPTWIERITGAKVPPLEGAFWSLYVESKFYVIAALLFFSVGRARLIAALFVLGLLAYVLQVANKAFPSSALQWAVDGSAGLSLDFFGWFAVGAAMYVFTKTEDRRWLVLALLFSVASAATFRFGFGDWKLSMGALVAAAVFIVPFFSAWARAVLDSRLLQFFGFISYPLYLLHEDILVASVVKLGHAGLPIPQGLYPFIPLAGLCLAASVIAKHVEPWIRRLLTGRLFPKPDSAAASVAQTQKEPGQPEGQPGIEPG
jgi:peptidoglycan/LPS O-acetylase OafA/YrhL